MYFCQISGKSPNLMTANNSGYMVCHNTHKHSTAHTDIRTHIHTLLTSIIFINFWRVCVRGYSSLSVCLSVCLSATSAQALCTLVYTVHTTTYLLYKHIHRTNHLLVHSVKVNHKGVCWVKEVFRLMNAS